MQALSNLQAKPYLANWEQDTEAQKAFWKTRKPQPKQGDKKEEGKEGGAH